jgi:hypothetical protein
MRNTDFLVMFLRESSCTVVVGSLKWKMRNKGSPFLARDTAAAAPSIFSCHFSKLSQKRLQSTAAQCEDDVVDDDERGQ